MRILENRTLCYLKYQAAFNLVPRHSGHCHMGLWIREVSMCMHVYTVHTLYVPLPYLVSTVHMLWPTGQVNLTTTQ